MAIQTKNRKVLHHAPLVGYLTSLRYLTLVTFGTQAHTFSVWVIHQNCLHIDLN